MVVDGGGWWWKVVEGGGRWWKVMGGGGRWWMVVDGGGCWWRVVEGGGLWWILVNSGGWCLYLDLVPRLFVAGLPGDTEKQVDAEVHRVPVGDAVTPRKGLVKNNFPLVIVHNSYKVSNNYMSNLFGRIFT